LDELIVEWLILTFVGVAVVLYALVRLALMLDAMLRQPKISDELRRGTKPADVIAAPDRAGRHGD
jgi:Na+-transporting methylmalonyl-CoA/oxaloacetate decarboxylase gamma subunit